jgi:hypothetical protein
MTARPRLRAGALGVAGVLVVIVLSVSPAAPADARGAKARGTVDFGCSLTPMDQDFDWTAKITLLGKRAKPKARAAKLTAKVGKMIGVTPRPVRGVLIATLTVKVGNRVTSLSGKRAVDAAAGEPLPMPRLHGRVKVVRGAQMLPVVVTSIAFEATSYDSYGTSGACTPTDGEALSTLVVR